MSLPAPEAFEYIFIHVADPIFGAQLGKATLRVHTRSKCKGQPCCIHNPSDHRLRSAPLNWRADRGLMERICRHGNGHPDPDDIQVKGTAWGGMHGCACGCCGQSALSAQEVEDLQESFLQMSRNEGRTLYPLPPDEVLSN